MSSKQTKPIEKPLEDTEVNANKSNMAGTEKRSRALNLVLGKNRQQHQIENKKDEFSTPPSKRKHQHVPIGKPQNTPPQFDPKIETGYLRNTKSKFLGDDLDLSKSLSSPLSVSTPTESLPVKRTSDKAKLMSSRCPLINGVRPAVRKDEEGKATGSKHLPHENLKGTAAEKTELGRTVKSDPLAENHENRSEFDLCSILT